MKITIDQRLEKLIEYAEPELFRDPVPSFDRSEALFTSSRRCS